MRTAIGLALLVIVSFSLSCGPSEAQIRKARDTEYPADALVAVYDEAKNAMLEAGYDLAFDDPQRGILVSTYRWYSKEGQRKRANVPQVREGDAAFRIGVEIVPSPRGIKVHIDGGAQGYTAGSPVPQVFAHGDPREPTWVDGKIDALTISIYSRLHDRELPPVPAPGQK